MQSTILNFLNRQFSNETERAFTIALIGCSTTAFGIKSTQISLDLSNADRSLASFLSLHFAYKLSLEGIDFSDPIYPQNAGSLQHAILKGFGNYDDAKDLKRICNAIRILPHNTDLDSQSIETICSYLDKIPFASSTARLIYKIFDNRANNIDFTQKNIYQYILILTRANLANKAKSPSKPELYWMPVILKHIPFTVDKHWINACLELLCEEIISFFSTNDRISYFKCFSTDLNSFFERRNESMVDITNVCNLLHDQMFKQIPNDISNGDFSVILRIFANLSPYFIRYNDPLPPAFSPERILIPYIRREHLKLFKESVEAINKVEMLFKSVIILIFDNI